MAAVEETIKTLKKIKALTSATKIDLACGARAREGFFGIDIAAPEADLQWDLMSFPWPIADDSVEEFHCSHFVEHIPMGDSFLEDPFCLFMNEVHRCLRKPVGREGDDDYVPGGQITIIHPALRSHRAFQDPTHRRFIPPETWNLYTLTCDFEPHVSAVGLDPAHMTRNQQAQDYAMRHYWEVYADLQVILKAR